MVEPSPVGHDTMSFFRPPIVRSAGTILDRSLFTKIIPSAAARLSNRKDVSRIRKELERSKDILRLERLTNVRDDPDIELASKGGKCVLLKPQVKPADPITWSPFLQEAVKAQEVGVIPYDITLDYNYWTYLDVMTSILPEDVQGEIPVGFALVGHIAHLNLREQYLPYKKLIAEVLVDKNPTVRTVINKTDDVGEASEYRTFSYEVLLGEDDMNVELRQGDCTFQFDYSKVYWNTRLQTEHKRLVDMFKPGEVVCDVMAGVGPFAVPAGKKGVFVWANDLNPDSYACMRDAATRNKVQNFVRTFCGDGRKFIHNATDEVLHLTATKTNTIAIPPKRPRGPGPWKPPPPKILTIPQTINHFVMNLPASAIEFVDSFNGLYHGHDSLFEPHTNTKLPLVHIHCFSTKPVGNGHEREIIDICERISKTLGYEINPGYEELIVHNVRDVAPNKTMFCASFRIPAEVAFRERR